MKNKKNLIYIMVLILSILSTYFIFNGRKDLATKTFVIAQGYGSNIEDNSFIFNKLYEGLTRINKAGDLEGGIGESWVLEGKTWTFNLRKNAKLTNGQKIKAKDFVDSILRNFKKQEMSKNKLLVYNIKGSREYENGISDSIKGLRAIDDYTLEFELNERISYFPKMLSNKIFFLSNEDGELLNNGAFLVKDIGEEKTLLEKSKVYWDIENIEYDLIKVLKFRDEHKILERYEAEEIYMLFLDKNNYGFFQEHRDFKSKANKNFTYLGINNKSELLKNKNIRKAIAYGVNVYKIKKELDTSISLGRSFVLNTPREDRVNIAYDLERARQYMALALSELNKEINDISVLTALLPNTRLGQRYKKILEDIFSELGLKIRVDNPSLLIRRQKINQGDYDIYIGTTNILYNSQIAYLEPWLSKSREAKLVNFSNYEYDELILEIRNDINKFQEFVKLGEELLVENMPVIPLFIEEEYFLSK